MGSMHGGGITLGVKIADGRTSEVFRVGEADVVKLLKPGVPAAWAEIEAAMIDSVGTLGVPVPQVRGLVDLDGRQGIVLERIDGPTMWQRLVDRPGDADALSQELFAVQRTLHCAGVPDGLPSLVERMHLKIGDAEPLTASDQAAAIELLGSLPPGAALLHGDLHPGNVMLGSDGLRVIDWFDATVGHPAADIARTVLLLQPREATDLRHLPGAPDGLIDALSQAYDRCIDDAGIARYLVSEWTRLVAASRLAEGTDSAVDALVDAWRSPAITRR